MMNSMEYAYEVSGWSTRELTEAVAAAKRYGAEQMRKMVMEMLAIRKRSHNGATEATDITEDTRTVYYGRWMEASECIDAVRVLDAWGAVPSVTLQDGAKTAEDACRGELERTKERRRRQLLR